MNWYLKAPPWQLFIILFGGMLLAQFITVRIPFGSFYYFIPTFLFGLIFFGWIWIIAKNAYEKLPPELSSSPKIMGAGLIYALSYMLIGGAFFFNGDGQFPAYAIPLHLLAMVAIIYSLGFTAKQLMKLKYQKNVTFAEYCGPLFLLWFFPIGVWFIQPVVNELYGKRRNA